MDILRVFARLLDYPTEELYLHMTEVIEAIRTTPYLPVDLRKKMIDVVSEAFQKDIYDLQIRYDELFDRGRYHSLLIFEHVHGESRARGQAMVNLLNLYKDAGFDVDSLHLPDYLPLFLEFLSTQEDEVAATWLADVSHILILLAERLRKSQAWEAILFESMLLICGSPIEDEQVKVQVAAEENDRTLHAIDKEWEDKEIRFDEPIEESGCGGCHAAVSTDSNHVLPLLHEKQLNITDHDVIWIEKSTC